MADTINRQGNPSWFTGHEGGASLTDIHSNMSTHKYNTQQTNNRIILSTSTTRPLKRTLHRPGPEEAKSWKKRKLNQSKHETPSLTTNSCTKIQEEIRADEARELTRWHVPRVGHMSQDRPDATFRIMGGQLNGMCTRSVRDRKLRQIESIMSEWDVQAGCFQEIGINWSALPHQERMDSWFRHNRNDVITTTAHNTNESFGPRQQGGVAIIVGDELRSYAKEKEPDFRGLGRWCSWKIYITPEHVTRIISTYNLGKQKSQHLGTVYQQHKRYAQIAGLKEDPQQLFISDFISQLTAWQKAGERLLIFADMNEHIINGKLAKQLFSLDLEEATHLFWTDEEPHTYIDGKIPIDGVYHSRELEIVSSLQLSFHEGVGDHRTVLVDITSRSLLGQDKFKILRPAARRLNSSDKTSTERYVKYVEKELERRNLHDKLCQVSFQLSLNNNDCTARRSLEHIDRQTIEIQTAGEKKCRKICAGPIAFSLPVSYWVHKKWAYQALARVADGRCKNVGNALRRARQAGITDTSLTLSECTAGIHECIERLKVLSKSANGLRKVHLRDRLINAEDMADSEKYKAIRQIIAKEEQRSTWKAIKRVVNDPRLGAITKVEQDTATGMREITTLEGMAAEIQRVTEKRFELAVSAPVTQSSLRHTVGFLADTPYALDLVSGRADIPADVDEPTRLVIEEMQRLWSEENNTRFDTFSITKDDFCYYWRKAKETTSSSFSNIHFGHYKAATRSDIISEFLANKLSVIGSYGVPPERWGIGLQVMLEKVAGVALVEKLRAILLMEADYNFFNKWVFGFKAMDRLYLENYIPNDQYSQRESTAEDARMDSRFTYDISRQLHIPMATVSVDADKCYDRINHIIMSLLLLSLIGVTGLVTAFLHPIQSMKFYQRTAFGDSTTFMGGRNKDNPLQGLCQGNGAAPACWLMVSSLLMHCYHRKGWGSSLLSPISGTLISFLGEIYVDDTDLIIIQPSYKTAEDLWDDLQASVMGWGNLLLATGGALNPTKCSWYLTDYICVDGEWEYAPTVDWELHIPLPGGDTAPIPLLPTDHATKMLGVWSSPNGRDDKHINENIIGRYKKWLSRSKNGHLPAKLNWMSHRFSLWTGMRYGLATLASSHHKLSSQLRRLDFEALSLLGVNKHVKVQWRTIPREFGGIGLYSLQVEQTLGWINMVLQHYGVNSTLGHKCKMSLECLQLEIGCVGNPLREKFSSTGHLAADSWWKSVWERSNCFRFEFLLDYPTLPLPRENDCTLVQLFIDEKVPQTELRILNRCRLALRAIFLSDISSACGRRLEPWATQPNPSLARDSKFSFPREEPTTSDWLLWTNFWASWLKRDQSLPTPLGRWRNHSHQQWRWFFNPLSDTLLEVNDGRCMEFVRGDTGRRTRGTASFIAFRCLLDAPSLDDWVPATVDMTSGFLLLTTGAPLWSPPPVVRPSFWEFVRSHGGEWMWQYVEGDAEDLEWFHTALSDGTAVLVTDGSFNKSLAPDISGAGWIATCTRQRKMVGGWFYEKSPKAGSYRGELLGSVAIHLLASFTATYYDNTDCIGKVYCDNKGALQQASKNFQRVRTGAKHADLLRALRSIKSRCPMTFAYCHVRAHQDQQLPWGALSLIEQLNVTCDTLAGQAVMHGQCGPSLRRGPELLLPNESAAVIIDGYKLTSDVSDDVRHHLGKEEARKFFLSPVRLRREVNIGGLGWTSTKFDAVDWAALRTVLASKTDMYGIWLAKQTIGNCATRRNIARITGSDDDRCPNCLCGPERHDHLLRCSDPGRTALFEEDVSALHSWMTGTANTNDDVAFWINKYLLLRGEANMQDLGEMPPDMAEVAKAFDTIGWVDITHGRLPVALRRLQINHCRTTGIGSGDTWMTQFTRRLIDIAHGQWLYRNFTLHNRTNGYLLLKKHEEVLTSITHLAECKPEEIPEDSRFLLEVDSSYLSDAPLVQQEYWVAAMKAALTAGRRVAGSSQHHRRCRLSRRLISSRPQRVALYRIHRRAKRLLLHLREELDLHPGSRRNKRHQSDISGRTGGSNKRLRKPD